jgi:hypothetical protein
MDEQRTAQAQAYRRLLNELIEQRGQDAPEATSRHALIRVWCECGAPDCDTVIEVHHGEYEAARLNDRRFLCAPGHLVHEVDMPLVHGRRCVLVEVRPEYAAIAEAMAPTHTRRHTQP